MSDNVKEDLLLHGDSLFDEKKNKVILKATISYIKKLKYSLDPFLINVSFAGAMLHVFFVALFIITIIITEKNGR